MADSSGAESIKLVFSIVFGIITIVIWFTRLESKTRQNEKDLIDYKKDMERICQDKKEMNAAIWQKIDLLKDVLNEVMNSITRIETKMDFQNKKDN